MASLSDKLMNGSPSQTAAAPASRIKQNHINAVDQKRIATIKTAILAEGDRIRAKYPVLAHQDAIGMGILLFSMIGALLTGWAYLEGALAWYITIPVIAIFLSFTHELEHDLIHYMYFRKNKFMHNLMMALVWICRPSTINPWLRRHLHLHHHKHSGTATDLEERAITNGERFTPLRVLMMLDLELSVVLRILKVPKHLRFKALMRGAIGNFPLATIFYTAYHAYVAYWAIEAAAWLVGYSVPWPAMVTNNVDLANTVAVLVFAPNLLRSFSINFISSNMHYFGDIEDGNFVQQCQVLNSKWFVIPHLFCFNFGSTHGIHHFVVRDPFYIRQMTAKKAHEVMRANGVRFNDLGTFTRANRWGNDAKAMVPVSAQ
ncbi:MAG TPA: fatty acid desaturase [Limnobacter sp.]|uniref:fatty acid desaturase n=1 Tax=Limnobacter sp. TaxID=2003368 RepID=UPI002EDA2D33